MLFQLSHIGISPYKTTRSYLIRAASAMNFVISLLGIFQNYRLLLAHGLWSYLSGKVFSQDFASRSRILFGGKQLMVRIELTITVLQTVPLTSWVHEQAPTIAAAVHDSLCELAMAE